MDKIQIKISKKHLVIISMVLMVALVLGMGAMTYAKYTSSYKSDNNTATAAKWGFVVTADATHLFGKDYTVGYENGGQKYATKVDDTGVAVHATTAGASYLIVAPGTSGYASINVSGVAEVRARLTLSVDITSLIGYNVTEVGGYVPIQWAISEEVDPKLVDNWGPASAIGTIGYDIAAGVPLNQKAYYVHWRWDFQTGEEGDWATNNRHDTIIGAKASDPTLAKVKQVTGDNTLTEDILNKYSTTLTFSINATIEQIQEATTTP